MRDADAILDSAARVLAESETASMDEIATAAGVGRATLYRRFPTRDALLRTLSEYAVDELAKRLHEAKLGDVPVDEAIARVARAALTVGDRYGVLVREQVRGEPDVVEKRLRGPVRRVVRRGQRDGTFRSDVDPDVLLDLFGGLVNAAHTARAARGLGLEDAAALVTSVFLRGAAA